MAAGPPAQPRLPSAPDPHDLERVNLLGDLHGADLGSDVRSHLSRQDDGNDGGGEFKDHGLPHRESDGVGRDPTADLVGCLNRDDGAHEQAQQRDDTDTLDTDGLKLHEQCLTEDPPFLGTADGRSQEGEISSDVEEQSHPL